MAFFFLRATILSSKKKKKSRAKSKRRKSNSGVSLRLHSNLLYQKFVMKPMAHARSAWWLEIKSYARTIAPPPPHGLWRQPRKKTVLPSKYSGSVAGRNADSVLPKLFFWGKGFGKTSADFPRGGGVWGGIRAGFWFQKVSARDRIRLLQGLYKTIGECLSRVHWLGEQPAIFHPLGKT
ncbi:MAG: hypothetical protein G01um101429_559 [Parcubacteria group bacterium Gr01-1014_29]|nr:MAG: hypothetical protein G01um101429_559 [Parcubacteria group bacterium Gr01-1014_29]